MAVDTFDFELAMIKMNERGLIVVKQENHLNKQQVKDAIEKHLLHNGKSLSDECPKCNLLKELKL